jgi:phosphohistidine phosphatase
LGPACFDGRLESANHRRRVAQNCAPLYQSTPKVKTLFLLRHAKSSWDDASLSDQDRPLSDRGQRDAPRMATRLAKRGLKFDLIISSPACRALATAQIFADALHFQLKRIRIDDRLYPGTAGKLFTSVRELSDGLERVMLVGHNPALVELAHRLCGEMTPMPTCALAELHFHAKSWSEVDHATLSTVALDRPRKSWRDPSDR